MFIILKLKFYIGGLAVIIIRFNPDKIKNKGKEIKIDMNEKLEMLTKTIKNELSCEYNQFVVKLIQLYYDDDYEDYNYIKIEDITTSVCI